MSGQQEKAAGTLPTWALAVGVVLAGAAMMAVSIQAPPAVLAAAISAAALTALTEGGMAAIIVIAAAGYGYPLVRRLCPGQHPLGLLLPAAALVGLWLLGTAVLAAGSLAWGLLKGWLWWPIVGGGVILAAWQGRARMEAWRFPRWLDGRALIWIIIALAAGLWIAGATLPPGYVLTFGDAYDVLEYHLQLPREYYDNQHVSLLPHNIYSHYPLGVEMLYLLCMCLRGGAYEGMYGAKLIHGMFGVLAVGAVFAALRQDDGPRARFSAAVLATTPLVVYLSWLAMVELAELCYLAAGLLWLRQWIRSPRPGPAVLIGAMLGGACAVKYLAVGFVVAPVAAVMLIRALVARRAAMLGQTAAAMLVAGAMFSPWLIRNAVATGNPVFPLASTIFGRPVSWPAECQKRWIDGHAAQYRPPVPPPPNYPAPAQPTRAELFYKRFILSQWFGPPVMVLAAIAVCVMAASATVEPWEWSLAAVAAMQLGVWAFFTRGMPRRFAVVVVVPMTLLAGYLLARLAAVETNPFRKAAPRPSYGPWGMGLAVALLVAAAAVNLLVCHGIYTQAGGIAADGRPQPPPAIHGWPGAEIARKAPPWDIAYELPEGSRLLLVGDAKAFYFPPGSDYATVFNAQPLDEMIRANLTASEMLARLREMKVTHLWFDWAEITRLAGTYGFPASLSGELVERLRQDQPPSLEVIRELEALGMTQAATVEFPTSASAPASAPPSAPAEGPATAPAPWPLATVYALPSPRADQPASAANSPDAVYASPEQPVQSPR